MHILRHSHRSYCQTLDGRQLPIPGYRAGRQRAADVTGLDCREGAPQILGPSPALRSSFAGRGGRPAAPAAASGVSASWRTRCGWARAPGGARRAPCGSPSPVSAVAGRTVRKQGFWPSVSGFLALALEREQAEACDAKACMQAPAAVGTSMGCHNAATKLLSPGTLR